jgi:hypothetical protein
MKDTHIQDKLQRLVGAGPLNACASNSNNAHRDSAFLVPPRIVCNTACRAIHSNWSS